MNLKGTKLIYFKKKLELNWTKITNIGTKLNKKKKHNHKLTRGTNIDTWYNCDLTRGQFFWN